MLKIYKMPNGHRYQFDEGNAPVCAVPVKKEKAKKTANKAKKATNKARKADNK